MPKEISSQTHNSTENCFEVAASFASGKIGLLLIRHPIHVIQTIKQADPGLTNAEIVSKIYLESGIRGFYKSTLTSFSKIVIAESYRGILMIKVPEKVPPYLPQPWLDSFPLASKLATSLIATPIISVIDATMICPITRMATLQVTTKKNRSLKTIYKRYIHGNELKELYRGYTPLLMQTLFSWTTFFVIDDLIKSLIQKHFNNISYTNLALASLAGGTIQTFINVIPDTIRVQMQKTASPELNMRNTAKNLIKHHGIGSFFWTVPHRLTGRILAYAYSSIMRHYWETHQSQKSRLY